MRRLRLGLTSRIALALAAVGLVPLLLFSLSLFNINRDALEVQVLQTHSMAARTAAGRVESYLSSLRSVVDSAAVNPVLSADPGSAEAQELLAGVLQARPDVVALSLVNDRGELVVGAQRRESSAEVSEILSRPLGSELQMVRGPTARWLVFGRPLPQEIGVLRAVATAEPLAEAVETIEFGDDEADIVLTTKDGDWLEGTATSLEPFPPSLMEQAQTQRLEGAGEFATPDGGAILGAYAPVGGTDWVIVSRQPAEVAERVERTLRRRSFLALGMALLLVGGLFFVAQTGLVQPVRDVIRSQRKLAGLSAEPGRGNEIADLKSSFEILERRLREKEEIGKVFLGRYQVVDVLGEGAMGSVFRGWDPRLERRVALKTVRLTEESFGDERRELATKLLREATTAARFNHPHIVAIYDVEDTPEVAFIAMEFIDGIGLDRLLWQRGRLPIASALALFEAIADALATSHKSGVVHRDVKPANVLLGYEGEIKVADFGISEFLTSMSDGSQTFFGTPGYVPPETLRGKGYDQRGDLFALGVVMYECLTGRPPFAGKDVRDTALKTVRQEPDPITRSRLDVPSALERLLLSLLAKDPGDRPASALEVLESLQSLSVEVGAKWDPSYLPRKPGKEPPETVPRSRMMPTLAADSMRTRPSVQTRKVL